MNIVEVDHINKDFQDHSLPVVALKDVSLSVTQGDFMALCGPSGSGKTTLLNLIGCLDKATSGRVLIGGVDVGPLDQSRLTEFRLHKLGFIFQDFNLIPTLSAKENIEYVLWLQGIKSGERQSRIQEVCTRFGISHLLDRRPAQLSRGQQQRVAVARAIIHKPLVVLGDELTANLDHKTGVELMDFLRELNEQEGITFIYATHDPVMIERGKTVVRMLDGMLVSQCCDSQVLTQSS